MLFIIFVLLFLLAVTYAVVTPQYLPSFLNGKDLVLGDVRAEQLIADTLTLRNKYLTSIQPTFIAELPTPLDDAPIDTGTWNGGTLTLEGYAGTYSMRTSRQDTVAFNVKPPSGWKSATPMQARMHFVPRSAAAGNLDLRLWYKKTAVGGTFDTEYSNVRITKAVFASSQDKHLTAIFPEIDMTDDTEQTNILFALERQANGGDSTDTFAGDINLIQVEIEFQVNKIGKVG